METQPGDILTWNPNPLTRFKFGHSAIVGVHQADMGQVPMFVNVTTAGMDVQNLSAVELRPNWVYQCNHSVLAKMAGKTALAWKYAPDSEGAGYSTAAAIRSAFHRAQFNPQASERAAEYRRHSAVNGEISGRTCPPTFCRRSLTGSRKFLFCSMFAVACYQAVTYSDAQIMKYMGLDAIHTTPAELSGYLNRNRGNWERASWADYGFPGK